MPYRMWSVKLSCLQPACYGKGQTTCGLYKNVQQVLGLEGFYSTANELLESGKCHKKYIGWSDTVRQ